MVIILILLALIFGSNTFAISEQVDRNMYMREYHQEKREEQKKKKKAQKIKYKQRPGGKHQPKKRSNESIDIRC